jgi:putative phosphoribosyl transferase
MFANRTEAGQLLADELLAYRDENPIVLAIPRGGVPVGYEVASKLHCDFDIVIARKLGYPRQPEAAIGAIAEDKSLYLNPNTQQIISRDLLQDLIDQEQEEISRRITRYRNDAALPSLTDRTIILVDDGAATGATLFAVIAMCQKQKPRRLIVALPVSSTTVQHKLERMVDVAIILTVPRNYYAVSQAYEEFQNMSDREIVRLMNKADRLRQDPTQP